MRDTTKMGLSLWFILLSTVGCTQEIQPLNSETGEKWTIDNTRSDEFNDLVIDHDKWVENPKHVQTWSWDNDNNIELREGSAIIQMVYNPHNRNISNACSQGNSIPNSDLYFKSAMLQTKASGILGYYEARILGSKVFPGFSPAFWIYSNFDDNQLAEGAVRYSEVDIVEMQQRQNFKAGNEKITDHNLHAALTKKNAKANSSGRDWRRPGKFHEQENVNVLTEDPGKVFHVYGAKVTEQEIIWYVDKKEVGRSANNHWKQRPMQVALSLGLRKPYTEFKCNGFIPINPIDNIEGFNPEKFNQTPPSMTVDYVRVWTKKK